MITYESMKMFLVTFAFEALVILIAVAIIYNMPIGACSSFTEPTAPGAGQAG